MPNQSDRSKFQLLIGPNCLAVYNEIQSKLMLFYLVLVNFDRIQIELKRRNENKQNEVKEKITIIITKSGSASTSPCSQITVR